MTVRCRRRFAPILRFRLSFACIMASEPSMIVSLRWRNLNYPNYEVVVVNDGSTDGTRQDCRALRLYSPDQPRKSGSERSAQRRIRAARGEIIAFTDADCVADADWLTHLWRAFSHRTLPPSAGRICRRPTIPSSHLASRSRRARRLTCCWTMKSLSISRAAIWRFAAKRWRRSTDLIRCFAPPAMMWICAGDCRTKATRSALVRPRWSGIFAATRFAIISSNSAATAKPKLFCSLNIRLVSTCSVNRVGSGESMATSLPYLSSRQPRIYSGVFGRGLFQTLYQPPPSIVSCLPLTLGVELDFAATSGLRVCVRRCLLARGCAFISHPQPLFGKRAKGPRSSAISWLARRLSW